MDAQYIKNLFIAPETHPSNARQYPKRVLGCLLQKFQRDKEDC